MVKLPSQGEDALVCCFWSCFSIRHHTSLGSDDVETAPARFNRKSALRVLMVLLKLISSHFRVSSRVLVMPKSYSCALAMRSRSNSMSTYLARWTDSFIAVTKELCTLDRMDLLFEYCGVQKASTL